MEEQEIMKKNLNFIQKIRLKIYINKKNITIKMYNKLPDYIKNNRKILKKVVFIDNTYRELKISKEDFQYFSDYNLIQLIYISPDVTDLIFNCISDERKIAIYPKIPIYEKPFIEDELRIQLVIKSGYKLYDEMINDTNREKFNKYLVEHEMLEEFIALKNKDLSILEKQRLVKANPKAIIYFKNENYSDLVLITKWNIECLNYLDKNVQYELLNSIDRRYIEGIDIEILKKLNKEIRSEIINHFFPIDKIINLISDDDELFSLVSNKNKRKLIRKYVNFGVKQKLEKIVKKILLTSNVKDLKFFIRPQYEYDVLKTIQDFGGKTDDEIIEFILHSKLMSANGSLTPDNYILHDDRRNSIEKSITSSQKPEMVTLIQKCNLNQISKLVDIDSNYILPYVYDTNNPEKSKEKCKKLFEFKYNNNEIYKKCIDKIFDNYKEYCKKKFDGNKADRNYESFIEEGKNPLEDLKILFNEQILKEIKPEEILDYLNSKNNKEEYNEKFRVIIEKAYGHKAREILDSRRELDIYAINSLEVFDKRIIDNFGKAFVHDCISYNIADFSEFLGVIKDEKKLELFKKYYTILQQIFGSNVETMQKAIHEYSYVEDLLNDIKDKELTETQYLNLISVISSLENPFNISNIEDLNNYEEIANNELKNELRNVNSEESILEIKDVICKNIFGMPYYASHYSLDKINTFYNLNDISNTKIKFSDSEKKILSVLQFIVSENSPEKILKLSEVLMSEHGIRNPIVIQGIIDKIKEHQLEILQESLTTIDKLEKACIDESGKTTPKVYKEEKNGKVVYHFNGLPFAIFNHNPANMEIDNIINYEGQAENEAICTRIVHSNMEPLGWNSDINRNLIYLGIDKNMLIDAQDSDASTTHIAKQVYMSGNRGSRGTGLKGILKLKRGGNEVAFYRRYRDHKKVRDDNRGGKRLPDAYGIDSNDYKRY